MLFDVPRTKHECEYQLPRDYEVTYSVLAVKTTQPSAAILPFVSLAKNQNILQPQSRAREPKTRVDTTFWLRSHTVSDAGVIDFAWHEQ